MTEGLCRILKSLALYVCCFTQSITNKKMGLAKLSQASVCLDRVLHLMIELPRDQRAIR